MEQHGKTGEKDARFAKLDCTWPKDKQKPKDPQKKILGAFTIKVSCTNYVKHKNMVCVNYRST